MIKNNNSKWELNQDKTRERCANIEGDVRAGSAHSFNPITPPALDCTLHFYHLFSPADFSSVSAAFQEQRDKVKGDNISAGPERQKQIPANQKHFGWEFGEKERCAER